MPLSASVMEPAVIHESSWVALQCMPCSSTESVMQDMEETVPRPHRVSTGDTKDCVFNSHVLESKDVKGILPQVTQDECGPMAQAATMLEPENGGDLPWVLSHK